MEVNKILWRPRNKYSYKISIHRANEKSNNNHSGPECRTHAVVCTSYSSVSYQFNVLLFLFQLSHFKTSAETLKESSTVMNNKVENYMQKLKEVRCNWLCVIFILKTKVQALAPFSFTETLINN